MFNEGLKEFVVGQDALAPERLYEKIFSITHQKVAYEKEWARNGLLIAGAALDLAMWDILGKASGQPLFRLLGGYRDAVPCYVTCAYYRDGKDLGELREEMEMLRAQGHQAFKAKIGGASLAEDMERLRVIRDVIGEDAQLMLDVNSAWDLPTAIEGARLLKEVRPRWLEEPVRWFDDRRELKILAAKTDIPLSAGESEMTGHGVRALLEEQAIEVVQFDCTRMGGFTMGRKLAALAELNHVEVAPHHDCFIHAHVVAASPAGCIVESFTDPERDPAPGRIVRKPPAHRERNALPERRAGAGAHALRRGDSEVRHPHRVRWGARRLMHHARGGLPTPRRSATPRPHAGAEKRESLAACGHRPCPRPVMRELPGTREAINTSRTRRWPRPCRFRGAQGCRSNTTRSAGHRGA